jgi:hypothetical protein
MILDPKIHLMMCSRCYHLNEVSRGTCEQCHHDGGTPVFRESAERMRELYMRLGAGRSDK